MKQCTNTVSISEDKQTVPNMLSRIISPLIKNCQLKDLLQRLYKWLMCSFVQHVKVKTEHIAYTAQSTAHRRRQTDPTCWSRGSDAVFGYRSVFRLDVWFRRFHVWCNQHDFAVWCWRFKSQTESPGCFKKPLQMSALLKPAWKAKAVDFVSIQYEYNPLLSALRWRSTRLKLCLSLLPPYPVSPYPI